MISIPREAVLAACCALLAAPASADNYACDALPVEVHAPDDGMLGFICTASAAALAFLRGYDLRPSHTIRIEIVEQAPEPHGYLAYGSYDSRTDTIELMSLPAVLNGSTAPKMYDEPFDEEHYRGVIAHEVAHAVVQHNGQVLPLSNTAQEYFAHATQLAVMPEQRRAEIIGAAGVGAWEINDVISDIYMALSPKRFAVKSYLHLTSMNDPGRFVGVLLAAKWRYVYVQ